MLNFPMNHHVRLLLGLLVCLLVLVCLKMCLFPKRAAMGRPQLFTFLNFVRGRGERKSKVFGKDGWKEKREG